MYNVPISHNELLLYIVLCYIILYYIYYTLIYIIHCKCVLKLKKNNWSKKMKEQTINRMITSKMKFDSNINRVREELFEDETVDIVRVPWICTQRN